MVYIPWCHSCVFEANFCVDTCTVYDLGNGKVVKKTEKTQKKLSVIPGTQLLRLETSCCNFCSSLNKKNFYPTKLFMKIDGVI